MKRLVVLALLLSACSAKKAPPAKVDVAENTPAAPTANEPKVADPKVATFWKWFADNAKALHDDQNLQGVMEKISAELDKVETGVFGEIGVDKDTRMLVISADGNKALFPAVQKIFDGHPTIAGWKIVAFRPRSQPGDGFSIEMNGKKLAPADVKFVSEVASPKLDVTIYLPGFDDSDAVKQVAFLLLDHTVGEYDMETKIGGIDFAAIEKAPAGAKPLPELAAAVDALH
ncbi:MAG TPA: hypothetical protein VGM90_08005 [Kofleriaceae bacterium]